MKEGPNRKKAKASKRGRGRAADLKQPGGGEACVEMAPVYSECAVFSFESIGGKEKSYRVPAARPVRIYCDGIYDLFHYGHMRSLEQAKKLFPSVFLLVGVCLDSLTHKLKGRTVMTMEERAEALRHCRWVDEVITDAPWVVTQEFLDAHSIDYVAHDPQLYPSAESAKEDVYAEVKRMNRFIPTMRTEGVSTSGLITRILSSYDEFIRRNLERGCTARDLNISVFTEKRVRVSSKVGVRVRELKKKMKEFMDVWEKTSREFSAGFSRLFERRFDDGGITLWDKATEMLSFAKTACHE